MDSFSVAAGAVAPLMFFMALGFCVSRKAHFDSAAIANFNKLVFKVFLPANMFAAVYFSDMSKLLDPKLFFLCSRRSIGNLSVSLFFSCPAGQGQSKTGSHHPDCLPQQFHHLGGSLGGEHIRVGGSKYAFDAGYYHSTSLQCAGSIYSGKIPGWQNGLAAYSLGCDYKPYDFGRAFGSHSKIATVFPAGFLDQSSKRYGNRNDASGIDRLGGFFQFRKCGGGTPSSPGLYLFPPGPSPGSISGWCDSLWFPRSRTGDFDEHQYPSLRSGWLCHGPADGQ